MLSSSPRYGHVLGFGDRPVGCQVAVSGGGSSPACVTQTAANLTAVLSLDWPTDPMLVVMHVDSPEFPVNRCARAHRQVQLEVLQAICATSLRSPATHPAGLTAVTDTSPPSRKSTRRSAPMPCPHHLWRASGLDPLRTNVDPEASSGSSFGTTRFCSSACCMLRADIKRRRPPGATAWMAAVRSSPPARIVRRSCQRPGVRSIRRCVDADEEAAGSHVLVAQHRPLVGCHFLDLRDLAWVRETRHWLGERGSQLWRMSSEIEAPNECPTMDLEVVTIPATRSMQPENAVWLSANSRYSRGTSGDTRQLLSSGVHPAIAYFSSGHRPVDREVVGE